MIIKLMILIIFSVMLGFMLGILAYQQFITKEWEEERG